MIKLLSNIGNTKIPSVLKDPFNKTSVRGVYISVSDFFGRGDWSATGRVEFQNGETKGEQTFKGETFDEVALKVKQFLSELNIE